MSRQRIFLRVPVLALSSLLLSCGDSPLAVPRAAASLEWDLSTSGTMSPACIPGPHWSNAPASAEDAPRVSATAATGGMVIDGAPGATVTCRVAPRGDQYVVTGEVRSTTTDPQGNALLTELSLNVTLGDNQDGAQGTLYITDQKSADFAFSSDTAIVPPKPGCTFSVHAEHDALGVAPGRIWARVQCPHISDWRNRDKQECEIKAGFIVLEDCLRD